MTCASHSPGPPRTMAGTNPAWMPTIVTMRSGASIVTQADRGHHRSDEFAGGEPMRMIPGVHQRKHLVVALAVGLAGAAIITWGWRGTAADTPAPRTAEPAPDGWTAAAPRDEIRPEFTYDPHGGPDGKGCLVIRADGREGLDGCWTK